MAELDPAETFFDFKAAAAENDLANEVGSEKPEALKFLRYSNDQHPQLPSTMNSPFIQQAGQRAAISAPSPALAPLPYPLSQIMGTRQFTYGESTASHPTTLQQQQQVRPQLNVQQQQPAHAPASQSQGPIRNTFNPPPAHCKFHTEMYRKLGPSSIEGNLEFPPYIYQRLPASSTPNTQQQHAPLPPNVEHQKLRPTHCLQQPGDFPSGPGRLQQPGDFPSDPLRLLTGHAMKPAQDLHPTLSTIQQQPHQHQLQQNANHTPPLTQALPYPAHLPLHQQFTYPLPTLLKPPSPPKNPTKSTTTFTNQPSSKSSKPTGITKKPLGRKRKDAHKTGFINSTLPPELHTDTTKYGRNCLRGPGGEAKRAEEWNRPSVKSNNKSTSEYKTDSKTHQSPSSAKTSLVPETETEQEEVNEAQGQGQGSLGALQRNNTENLSERQGAVKEDVGAEAPGVGMGMAEAEEEQGQERMEKDEGLADFDIGNMDVGAEVEGFEFN